jgi:hypothetical protein
MIQSARKTADAIIINPAGYPLSSIAILDALKAFDGPTIEVHISNIHARDELHRHSKLSSAVKGVICGRVPYGYIVAMQAAARFLGKLPPRCRHRSASDSCENAGCTPLRVKGGDGRDAPGPSLACRLFPR